MHLPHPWRRLRELAHVTLIWADLGPHLLGLTDHATATVVLNRGLSQAQRRCTIAHELTHVERGPVPGWLTAREEREVDKVVARQLLPDVEAVGEALAWAHTLVEAADELWVDEPTLRARLEHLHPAERGHLRRRLAEGEGVW